MNITEITKPQRNLIRQVASAGESGTYIPNQRTSQAVLAKKGVIRFDGEGRIHLTEKGKAYYQSLRSKAK